VDYEQAKIFEPPHWLLSWRTLPRSWLPQLSRGIMLDLPDDIQLFIRWMNYNDIRTVCNLERRIFPSPWTAEAFLYQLDHRNYNISFVGLVGKELVAYAVSYLVRDELHISNLAVAPGFRRRKIGEVMLWLSMQIGKEKQCRVALLEVRAGNRAAISLYEKHGFRVVGVRKNYYQTEKEDALLMNRTLSVENIDGLV